MNRLSLILAAAVVLLCLSTTPALAQVINSIQIDERGNMLINGNPGPAGAVAVEPISGFPALAYPLPGFAGNVGDVFLTANSEPPGAGLLSDLIRFPGNGQMYFFSLIDDGGDPGPPDLADVFGAFIPNHLNNFVIIDEIGPEGLNGATWTPGAAGIGGAVGDPALQYSFISDAAAVPEPGSLLLATLGAGVMLQRRKRV